MCKISLLPVGKIVRQQATVTTLAKAAMDTPQITEAIREGVDTFMEAFPSLMGALDEVVKIYPFISGASPSLEFMIPDSNPPCEAAVFAFKTVYTLETKRRENDKRVLALYVECVSLGLVPSLSHGFQNERHDGSSRRVRSTFSP